MLASRPTLGPQTAFRHAYVRSKVRARQARNAIPVTALQGECFNGAIARVGNAAVSDRAQKVPTSLQDWRIVVIPLRHGVIIALNAVKKRLSPLSAIRQLRN